MPSNEEVKQAWEGMNRFGELRQVLGPSKRDIWVNVGSGRVVRRKPPPERIHHGWMKVEIEALSLHVEGAIVALLREGTILDEGVHELDEFLYRYGGALPTEMELAAAVVIADRVFAGEG